MQVGGRGCGGCEQAFEHPQLHAIIRDVIAAAQQLNGLRLWRHLIPIQMLSLISDFILVRGPLHSQTYLACVLMLAEPALAVPRSQASLPARSHLNYAMSADERTIADRKSRSSSGAAGLRGF